MLPIRMFARNFKFTTPKEEKKDLNARLREEAEKYESQNLDDEFPVKES